MAGASSSTANDPSPVAGSILPPGIASDVERPRAVEIAAQYHDIAHSARWRGNRAPVPSRLVTIPQIGRQHRPSGRCHAREQHLLAEQSPCSPHALRGPQLVEQPRFLRGTQHRTIRIDEGCEIVRLPVAEAASVEHDQIQ